MSSWIPQVRYGSHWMRRAQEHLGEPFLELKPLISEHARDEQEDYAILFEDYRCAGGTAPDSDSLRRNPGGEALNSFMFSLAQAPNPVSLLGAIYIIEGTGQRVIPELPPRLRARLDLPERAFRFLKYHGDNDEHHLARWLRAVEIVLAHDPAGSHAASVVETARATSESTSCNFSTPYEVALSWFDTQVLSEPHDEKDPSPWLALYLDQSVPMDDSAKRAWLEDTSSRSRQFLLPLLRPLARGSTLLIQLFRIVLPRAFASSRWLHLLLEWGMKLFLSPNANLLILRHFHLGSEILRLSRTTRV